MTLALKVRLLTDPLSQGDILSGVETVTLDELGTMTRKTIAAIVLTHSCELDKPNTKNAIVAELRPMSLVTRQQAELIKESRVLSAVHIGDVPTFGDSFVDFRELHRVPKFQLANKLTTGRNAALDDEGCVQIAVYLFRFFVRVLPQLPPPIA
ncbi:MAG TPA: hypothetical protein VJB14_15680 [Planctomycetota bacterium]|nr:hypothetical protein [Planctomycetota bacterium]